MLNFNILRSVCFHPVKRVIGSATFSSKTGKSSSDSASSSSNSDDDKGKEILTNEKANKEIRSEAARQKLHMLLTNMVEKEPPADREPLKLTKATSKRRKIDLQREAGTKSVKTETIDQKIAKVVKDVAESLGGDVKETESELLRKLLNPVEERSATSSFGELVKGMQIDKSTEKVEMSRAEQVRQLLKSTKAKTSPEESTNKKRMGLRRSRDMNVIDEIVNLHIDDRLGIFNSEDVKSWPDCEMNKTWKSLYERELKLAITHPPANYFQQMVLWTDQGKLWKFPIDNEQDLDEEQKIYFDEHIFLEKHLEGWCPPKGPIRYFMELVCVGLSKNPYITVQMKKEHIEWFKDYFKEKEDILKEVGAFPPGFEMDRNSLADPTKSQ
ncbi:hypothetical protein FQA39_LY12623 [Lamprigera yunnana]|nr:hypothetical protein FQA39_LY12623 [Lamprigera yunnana]